MTRSLLFDQNLAPRLADRLAAEFPGSVYVRDLDLQAATDAEVLRVAAERELIIVTKDKDFADIVTARGEGPRVLWLMLGNVSTDEIADSIREAAEAIGRLLDDPSVQVVQMAMDAGPLTWTARPMQARVYLEDKEQVRRAVEEA